MSRDFLDMGITIETRLNPYASPHSVLVSGSTHKGALCREVGIPVEEDPSKIAHVGNGEENHDISNGYGVVVRRRVVDVPYPVLVAQAKAAQLAPHFKPNGHEHVVADSTWEIMSSEGHVLSLNKPKKDRKKEEQIARTLYMHRGQCVSSDTGIAVLSHNLTKTDLYHLSLMLGVINPDLQMGEVERLIRNNPNTAGGFSVLDALSYGLISPDPMLHFRIRKINSTGAPFVSGRIMTFDTVFHELSNDSSNNEWIRRLAIGIIPKK